MEKEDVKEVIGYVAVRSIFLNIAAYLISVGFWGFTLPIAVGLVCGTLVMLINLFLLSRQVANIIRNGGSKPGTKMLTGYIMRIGIVVVVVSAAALWNIRCLLGTVIPQIYPKLVYGVRTLLRKEE